MLRRLSPFLLLCVAAACSGGDSPVDRPIGQGRIVKQVGPGGGILRGDGGTALEGFLLEIPEGALTRLVDIVVEPGTDIGIAGSSPASNTFAIRVRPDPGVLREPATLRVGLTLARWRSPEDLFVASRPSAERPTALTTTVERTGVAADFGNYDAGGRSYAAFLRTLTEVQVRIADRPRLSEDAFRLLQLGYESLARLTEAGLLEADLMFGEAQRADPFAGAPNLFRALSRVAVVLNDRADTGPGLDSVGEALERLGIDLGSLSLLDRARAGAWPSRIEVPADAPGAAEILELLRVRLRPAIELALRDLDRVPATTEMVVTLPAVFATLPGDREIDATDVIALRTVLTGLAFAVDHLADFELELDLERLFPRSGPGPSLTEALDMHPLFGKLVRAPDTSTVVALRATLLDLREAFEALAGEGDEQSDDLLVFPASFDESRRGVWRRNLAALQESLESDVESRVTLEGGLGSIGVRLGGPWTSGALSPRDLAPELFRFLPLADTLPDPTMGGAVPAMTQDRATDLLGLTNVHATPLLPIVADGSFADWTPAADALVPADPVGDTSSGAVRATDLWQVWFAENADDLAFRISVVDGAIGYRRDQANVWGIVVREVRDSSFGPPLVVEVYATPEGFDVRVLRGGEARPVRWAAAARGSDLEVTLHRFDVLDPDEPVLDRAVHAFAEGVRLDTGEAGRDDTRRFLVRF